jgi:hypothetical protein
LAQFGERYNPNKKPTPISDFEDDFIFTRDLDGQGDTDYTSGIQMAISDMEEIDAKEKILVILTDGEFQSEAIEKIYEKIKPSVSNGTSVYIALLCPGTETLASATHDWHSYFDNVNGFDVFGSAEEAGAKVLEQLKTSGFLLEDFKPLYISNSNVDVDIPGYSNTAIFSYWSALGRPLNINMDNAPFVTVLSDKTEPRTVEPKPLCGEIKFQIQALPPQENGLLFVTYKTFETVNLSVNVVPNNAVINNMPVEIRVTAADSNTVGKLGNWRDCFDIKLDTPEVSGNLFSPQFCEDDLYKCFSDGTNRFYSRWSWMPPSRGDLNNIAIQARLVVSHNENMEFTRKTENIPVIFSASYIGSTPLPDQIESIYPNEPLVTKIQRKIAFDFVVNDPQVRLFTSKTSVDELNEITLELGNTTGIPFVGCPVAIDVDGRLAIDLTDHNSLCDEKYALKDVLASTCTEENEISPLQSTTYIFETYSYVISKCGFNQLDFVWDAIDGVLASSLSCSIGEDSITCQ